MELLKACSSWCSWSCLIPQVSEGCERRLEVLAPAILRRFAKDGNPARSLGDLDGGCNEPAEAGCVGGLCAGCSIGGKCVARTGLMFFPTTWRWVASLTWRHLSSPALPALTVISGSDITPSLPYSAPGRLIRIASQSPPAQVHSSTSFR